MRIENRPGRVVAAWARPSSTSAEREAALALLEARGRSPDAVSAERRLIPLGADPWYQEEKFMAGLGQRRVVAPGAEYPSKEDWANWLSEEERNPSGLAVSQRKRKRVEKVFGWAKLDSILQPVKLRGRSKVDWRFRLRMCGFNLVRMVKLMPAQ